MTKLAERHRVEASFHDHKYATGGSFPRHYRINPTVPVFERMMDSLGELQDRRVLEYGCGTGWITTQLASRGASVSAFDISPEAVAQTSAALQSAGLASRCSVAVMGGEQLQYPDGFFDLAVGFAILHHLELTSALRELHRVLKPGGRAVFAEPLKSNPAIRLFRWLTPQFRTPEERPVDLREFRHRASAFRSFRHRDQLLLAAVPLALAFVPGLQATAQTAQRALMRADDALLKVAPWAGSWAWYSVLELEK